MSELQRHIDRKAARHAWGAEYRKYMMWAGRALEVPLSVVVGVGLGVIADKNLGVAPWGLYVGLFFGIVTGIRFAYRLTKAYQKAFPDDEAAPP